MLFLLLILHARSDDLEFVDYDKNTQYSWSDLQINNPYTIELDSVIIKFSVGENLKETCEGQYASAILFSKAGDSCHILGRHEDYFVYPFKIGKTRGIGIYYEGGGLCRDVLWGDVKRRTELKLLCSREESDFYLSNQLSDCTTILERRSKLGCPKEFEYSSWVKILFFTFYGLLGILLFWLCFEALYEDTTLVMPDAENSKGWSVKKYITKVSDMQGLENKDYYEV